MEIGFVDAFTQLSLPMLLYQCLANSNQPGEIHPTATHVPYFVRCKTRHKKGFVGGERR